jgi:hypothetical protein
LGELTFSFAPVALVPCAVSITARVGAICASACLSSCPCRKLGHTSFELYSMSAERRASFALDASGSSDRRSASSISSSTAQCVRLQGGVHSSFPSQQHTKRHQASHGAATAPCIHSQSQFASALVFPSPAYCRSSAAPYIATRLHLHLALIFVLQAVQEGCQRYGALGFALHLLGGCRFRRYRCAIELCCPSCLSACSFFFFW